VSPQDIAAKVAAQKWLISSPGNLREIPSFLGADRTQPKKARTHCHGPLLVFK